MNIVRKELFPLFMVYNILFISFSLFFVAIVIRIDQFGNQVPHPKTAALIKHNIHLLLSRFIELNPSNWFHLPR